MMEPMTCSFCEHCTAAPRMSNSKLSISARDFGVGESWHMVRGSGSATTRHWFSTSCSEMKGVLIK